MAIGNRPANSRVRWASESGATGVSGAPNAAESNKSNKQYSDVIRFAKPAGTTAPQTQTLFRNR